KEPPEVSLKDGAVPLYRLSDDAGGYVRWADGGETITWALGETLYRLPLSGAIDFAREQRRQAPEKQKKEAAEKSSGAVPEKDKDKEEKEKEKVQEARVPTAQTIAIAISEPRATPQGSYVLRGARVITMKGDEILPNADIVVTDNRIAAIGPS